MAQDIDIEVLLDELSEYFSPPRLPGDIDKKMIQAKFGCSEATALTRMRSIAANDQSWQLVTVKDPNYRNPILVLRKKNPAD